MEDTNNSKGVTSEPTWLKRLLVIVVKLIVWFGVLVRTILIPLFAVFIYQLIDPHGVWSVPFAELTLGMVFESLFTWLFVIFCIVWFFKFPISGSNEYADFTDKVKARYIEDAYIKWARTGGFILLIATLFYWAK